MFELWKLQDFAPGDGVAAGAARTAYDDGAWIDVPAPGDVHVALIAAGRIEDPFYDRNEERCGWMEEREWWYRLRFVPREAALAPDERLLLIFEGLDTYATVYLNGEEIGAHANMFREARCDVGGVLRLGEENTLAIRFDPPLRRVDEAAIPRWNDERLPRVMMRKAQFGYGWDWGPRLPTIGIWRPVHLRRQRRAAIAGVQFATLRLDRDADSALVMIRVEAERFAGAGELSAAFDLLPPGAGAGSAPAATGSIVLRGEGGMLSGTAYVTLEAPRLWWTHDLGEPALYALRVTLRDGDDELARHEQRVGIRTVELDQSPDPEEPGTRFFRFVLNGVSTFQRGADWIPADSFVGAIPDAQYRMLLELARDGNMTMLRVWGGGIYEHDIFYDLCDALGMLVWQDFMFACAPYPEDAAYAAEVDAEARYQVRRLRSHPSMALWCGNNENQWISDQHHWDQPGAYIMGSLYYDQILPRVVAELDGVVPYWPGSPYGGDDYNSMQDGDRHNWDVWHGMRPRRFGDPLVVDHSPAGVAFTRYADDRGRFISEWGRHAAPVLATLERVIPPDQRYHHSPSMDWHNKDNPKNKGDNLMVPVTGVPATLEQYVDFSMIAQAEGLKFGVEHYRRRMPHCAGSLVWQLNDCWPVLSWSVVDYYGAGKAGYYYLQRAYAPVLASFKALQDGAVELWVSNCRPDQVTGRAVVRLGTFSGETVWEEIHEVMVAAGASLPIARWSAAQLGAAPERYLAVREERGAFPTNRHFFAPIKDLPRGAAATVELEPRADGSVDVLLSSPTLAYFVQVSVPDEGARYSDNYVDLLPGERRRIRVWSTGGPVQPERISVRGPAF